MEKIFSGLKVVELAGVLAGPAVGMFFAELGAQVIKVENARTGGDVTRHWKLPAEDPNIPDSAYYRCVNWGKEIRFIDLEAAAGRQEVLDLVSGADIVLANFKPGSARRLGMDAPTLRGLFPRLIYAQVSGFGPGEADRPAFDIVLQAESGFLHMTGEPDREPVRMPVALIDLLAAHQLKEAILIALLRRQQGGEGATVSTTLFGAAVASLANQATNWLEVGYVPGRMGTRHPNIAPYGDIFYCGDRKPLVIAAGTEEQFRRLCEVLSLPELAGDPHFCANPVRVLHREALCERMAPAFARFTRDELLDRLCEAGVPAGAIRTMPEVFDLPAAAGMLLEEPGPGGTTTRRVRTVAFHLE